jgi:DNA-dependent RNA polymerase auxiliary subunit epsilon
MSKNFFLVEATPENENFRSIYVEAENEELARQLFCEYYSIPTSRRKDDICKA